MSRHWKPDAESARWTQVDDYAPTGSSALPGKAPWPKGATVGLLMVAAGCLALGALLYRVAGPRVVIEENAAPMRFGGPSPGRP